MTERDDVPFHCGGDATTRVLYDCTVQPAILARSNDAVVNAEMRRMLIAQRRSERS